MPQILDLTKRLNQDTEIYSEGAHSDPPLVIRDWCGIAEQGFWVSRLELGTQTGTHIDAPAHFAEGGARLETVRLDDLIGRYFWVPVAALADAAERDAALRDYDGERVLFLCGAEPEVTISREAAEALLGLGCPVWVMGASVAVADADPLLMHRMLAARGVFLVEDLDHAEAAKVRPGGELMALPLRLEGVSGSPCRVVVVQGDGDR